MPDSLQHSSEDVLQSPIEELFNAITCGIGLCLSIAVLLTLVVLASLKGDPWRIVSFTVYGISLVLLFTFSTLYHCFQSKEMKHLFEFLDHCAIYLLIAGTYTPFVLVKLRGPWGWSLFGVVWGLALAGIVFKIFFTKKLRALSNAIYLLMGWLVALAYEPLTRHLAFQGIVWLAAGGVIFSLGVIFFAWKKLPFQHVIWHVFVLLGCACHAVSIFLYVLPT